MNTMNYKGFIGSVAYSEEDNTFFGKIEGINALVNFEGDSVKELQGVGKMRKIIYLCLQMIGSYMIKLFGS